ncbi:MAG TPA: TlpA disulfide reductase family protein [Spirochaetia bacterium]|nr:TlpA disulfide reductase family protein [Spirochaetia bacterium]
MRRAFGGTTLAVLFSGLLLGSAPAAVWAQASASPADDGSGYPDIVIPSPAPEFAQKDIFQRQTIDLKRYRGKVVVLNFWATWCPPCKEEIPALKAIQAGHNRDVVVIGVSVFCSESSTELFYADYKINYPMIYGSWDMMGQYGKVGAIPTTFLIDRNGTIQQRVVGARTQDQYEALLKPLLAS